MKRTLGLFVILSALILQTASCRKDNKCKKCILRDDYEENTINLGAYTGKLYTYRDKEGGTGSFSFSDVSSDNLNGSIRELALSLNSTVQAIVLYSEDDVTKMTKISTSQLTGVVVYENTKENDFLVKIYKYANGLPSLLPENQYHSKIISPNDFNDIGAVFLNSTGKSVIGLIKFAGIPKFKGRFDAASLQSVLKNKKLATAKLTLPSGVKYHHCAAPCTVDIGYCTAQESQQPPTEEWICIPDPEQCKTGEVNEKTKESSIQTNLDNDIPALQSFRANYLFRSGNGIHLANLYYELSDSLSSDSLDLPLAINTADIISSHIMPIVSTLMTDPTSSAVVIDSPRRDAIIDYLTAIKDKYPSQRHKGQIDSMILDLYYFCGKPISSVDSFLRL